LGTGEELDLNELGKPWTARTVGRGIKGERPGWVVAPEVREKAFGLFATARCNELPEIRAGGGVLRGTLPRLRGGFVNGLSDLEAARGGERGGLLLVGHARKIRVSPKVVKIFL